MKLEIGVNFGDVVKDKVSGFEGVITGVTFYQNGCKKVVIEPQKLQENGAPIEAQWFDEQRVAKIPTAKGGGPMILPPKY